MSVIHYLRVHCFSSCLSQHPEARRLIGGSLQSSLLPIYSRLSHKKTQSKSSIAAELWKQLSDWPPVCHPGSKSSREVLSEKRLYMEFSPQTEALPYRSGRSPVCVRVKYNMCSTEDERGCHTEWSDILNRKSTEAHLCRWAHTQWLKPFNTMLQKLPFNNTITNSISVYEVLQNQLC